MKKNKAERISEAIEKVLPDFKDSHKELEDAVAKSDLTVGGVIASINNNVKEIGSLTQGLIKICVETETTKMNCDETREKTHEAFM